MEDLFTKMKVFAPSNQRTVVDIEIEKRVDFISVDLLTDEEGETVIYPHRINHPQFEQWLDDNGYFDREDVQNTSDTVTGEHVQTVRKVAIDYPIYLDVYLSGQDVWDYLVAMGKIRNMKYVPE